MNTLSLIVGVSIYLIITSVLGVILYNLVKSVKNLIVLS